MMMKYQSVYKNTPQVGVIGNHRPEYSETTIYYRSLHLVMLYYEYVETESNLQPSNKKVFDYQNLCVDTSRTR
jgi:hypothetical protein